MKIAQTEVLRVVDYYSVAVGNVDSTLNDGGAEQHVIFMLHKVEHGAFNLLSTHFSVGNDHTCCRHTADDEMLYVVKILDIVVDEKHLSATV